MQSHSSKGGSRASQLNMCRPLIPSWTNVCGEARNKDKGTGDPDRDYTGRAVDLIPRLAQGLTSLIS